MRPILRLSARNAWINRRASALTGLAIVLAVGFMSGVLILTGGFASQETGGLKVAYQGIPVLVHGVPVASNPPGEYITGSGAPLPPAAEAAVQKVPGVRKVVGIQLGFAVLEDAKGRLIGSPGSGGGIGQNWVSDARLNPYHLVAGRGPASAREVVIDQAAASHSHVTVGRELTLVTAAGRFPVTVVGIARLGDAAGPFDSTAVLLSSDSARSLLGGSLQNDQLLVDTDLSALGQIDATVRPWHASALSGSAWAKQQERLITTSLSFEQIFLLGFAAIALIASATLISNTFTVMVAKRSREHALARALGNTRRQLLTAVLIEAGILGAASSIVGAGVGLGIARVVRAVFSLLGLTLLSTHAVFSLMSVVLPVAIGLVATVLAAVGPAIRASSVPPIAALQTQEIDQSGDSAARAVLGLVVAGAGSAATAVAVASKSGTLVDVGLAGLILGSVIAGPILIRQLSRLMASPLSWAFGSPGLLAGRGMARNPRRSAATATALMLGILLVSFGATLVASVNRSTTTSSAQGVRAGFVVSTASAWRPQVTDSVMARIARDPQVTSTTAVYGAPARIGNSAVVVGTVDFSTINRAWDFGWTYGSAASLTGNQIAVQNTDLGHHHLGDRLDFTLADGTSQTFRIAAVFTHGFVGFNAPAYLLPEAVFHAHDAAPGAQLALVNARPDASLASLKAALGPDQSVKVRTAAQWVAQGNQKIKQVGNLFYALDALAVLIALVGVANTMALTIHERRRELGILRAVGWLPRQISNMVGLESVVLACYGTATGALLGVAGCWALIKTSTSSDMSKFSLPIPALAAAIGASVLSALLLAAVPAYSARRTSVLEAVTNE